MMKRNFFENPLLSLSGNFHGQYPAKMCDFLAISIQDIANISERRIERLNNHDLSGLPAFLVKEVPLSPSHPLTSHPLFALNLLLLPLHLLRFHTLPLFSLSLSYCMSFFDGIQGGLNSGFMIAHCTAAALTSENKSLAHPSTVGTSSTHPFFFFPLSSLSSLSSLLLSLFLCSSLRKPVSHRRVITQTRSPRQLPRKTTSAWADGPHERPSWSSTMWRSLSSLELILSLFPSLFPSLIFFFFFFLFVFVV